MKQVIKDKKESNWLIWVERLKRQWLDKNKSWNILYQNYLITGLYAWYLCNPQIIWSRLNINYKNDW